MAAIPHSGAAAPQGLFALLLLAAVAWPAGAAGQAKADPRQGPAVRLYIACDDHTDYFWTADPAAYRKAFVETLDYYLKRIEATADRPAALQARFCCDGWLWLWEYEKARSPGRLGRLIERIKDGHISVPLSALSLSQGGAPAEAVLRGMYYPGRIQRRYGGVPFELAYAVENPTYPLGLVSLWAGAGARYSWNGSYYGDTRISPDPGRRQPEMYWWTGRDGRRLLTKWYRCLAGDDLGGYAEARRPARAVERLDRKARGQGYPYRIAAAFGKGHDDLKTLTTEFEEVARRTTTARREVIVSNEADFFRDFEAVYGSKLPALSVSFGNDWDLYPATIAEVSAKLRRSVEKLRAAEALATLVALKRPGVLDGRQAARDRAFMALGMYWEHDFNMMGRDRAKRLAWQRRMQEAVTKYVDELHADAATALGGLIARSGRAERFYAFNPLGWRRTAVADYPHDGAGELHVVDLATGQAVPCQRVRLGGKQHLRVLAADLPPVGYRVFEIRPGAGPKPAGGPSARGREVENEFFRVTVAGTGAITSLIDKKRRRREMVRRIGGRTVNDLGPGEGSLAIENAGAVSVTLRAESRSPLAHTTRVTLYRGLARVDIRNEITQGFDCDFKRPYTWAFGLSVDSPVVHHEECGAVLRAATTEQGGHYAAHCSRLDWLTMNHFADVTAGGGRRPIGVTISNADCYFMKLAHSTPSALDAKTPQVHVLVGGRVGGSKNSGFRSQGGDRHFLQRFALRTHGAYDEAAAVRFAFEHQNPCVTGRVRAGERRTPAYPADRYSLLNVSDPRAVLWALKPSEEGIAEGVIVRLWNHSDGASKALTVQFAAPLAGAAKATHIETDTGPATLRGGALVDDLRGNRMQTYRCRLGSASASERR